MVLSLLFELASIDTSFNFSFIILAIFETKSKLSLCKPCILSIVSITLLSSTPYLSSRDFESDSLIFF